MAYRRIKNPSPESEIRLWRAYQHWRSQPRFNSESANNSSSHVNIITMEEINQYENYRTEYPLLPLSASPHPREAGRTSALPCRSMNPASKILVPKQSTGFARSLLLIRNGCSVKQIKQKTKSPML